MCRSGKTAVVDQQARDKGAVIDLDAIAINSSKESRRFNLDGRRNGNGALPEATLPGIAVFLQCGPANINAILLTASY